MRPADTPLIPSDDIYHQMLTAVEGTPMDRRFQHELCQLIHPPQPTALWPALSYWSGITAGNTPAIQIVVTAALTLARLASAILDDVQDGDKPMGAERLEPKQAVNVAVAIAFAVQVVLDRLRDLGVPSDRVGRAQTDYARVVMHLCGSQYSETRMHDAPSLDDYLTIVENRAAASCAFEARLPALLAGQAEENLGHFSEFGRQIGFMYQIANDFYGLHGLYGKAVDLGRQWSWPTLYALSVVQPTARTTLLSAWNAGKVELLKQVVIDSGAAHYLLLLSDQHYKEAGKALSRIENRSMVVDELRQLLERFRLHDTHQLQVAGTTPG
jgi:geranylgeranyl pyrophosphate synthase